jgi:hypothetical protein
VIFFSIREKGEGAKAREDGMPGATHAPITIGNIILSVVW